MYETAVFQSPTLTSALICRFRKAEEDRQHERETAAALLR